jgi:hypothetical protein
MTSNELVKRENIELCSGVIGGFWVRRGDDLGRVESADEESCHLCGVFNGFLFEWFITR